MHWRELYRRYRSTLLTGGVFAAGIAITIGGWYVVDLRVHEHARSKAESAMVEAADAIRKRLHSSHDIVYGLQGLFRVSQAVTREEFSRYASGLRLSERHPGVRSITYAERVPDARKARFEMGVREDRSVYPSGYPNFAIKPPG